MFKIDISKTYFFPVTVELPEDGKHKKISFDAEFNRLSKTENRAIFERFPSASEDTDIENPIKDDEILDLVFVGWKGIQDADGEPLAYSETAREKVLEIQGVSNGIIAAWFASIAGSAKAKN